FRFICIAFVVNICSILAANEDLITELPGLSKPINFKQYSGYLDASKGRHYFYWFFEATKDPENAPVVLWLTGGPGCSSLFASLTENGPFYINKDGKTVETRDHSWNTVANILYLESPAGTGFSYDSNNNYTNNDETTSLDNYLSLESFFQKYPNLKKNEFYITGESYAGVYIPMLAKQIYKHNSTINLKGLAIGNGALQDDMDDNFGQSPWDYALSHGLMTTDEYEKKVEACCECKAGAVEHQCDFSAPANQTKCSSVRAVRLTTPNPYNIYDNCYPDLSYQQLFDTYYRPKFDRIGLKYPQFLNKANKAECIKLGHSIYLNTDAVRKALHVREGTKQWSPCGGPYDRNTFTTQQQNARDLINTYKIPKFIVYNGDFDTVCDFIGDQRFVTNLGFKTTGHYRYVYLKKQYPGSDGVIGGFIQEYEKGLSFVVVRGAGHMVPEDKPEA
ncbi:unnamed protein product, partial [Oppiella nova]